MCRYIYGTFFYDFLSAKTYSNKFLIKTSMNSTTFENKESRIILLIDFNGMSTCIVLFYV